MGNNGMNRGPAGQTTSGGDTMEHQEITLGTVTYEVHRIFTGNQSVAELMMEHLGRAGVEKSSFDGNTNPAG